jgi:hypothetical protein
MTKDKGRCEVHESPSFGRFVQFGNGISQALKRPFRTLWGLASLKAAVSFNRSTLTASDSKFTCNEARALQAATAIPANTATPALQLAAVSPTQGRPPSRDRLTK